MSVIRISLIVGFCCFMHPTFSQRRIHNGEEVTKDMPFAVYFLKAAPSERKYLGWTCGGSLVSADLIITSAACVEDVKHLYVIAGYRQFVEAENINKNKCTKKRKKKVVFTCVPKAYDLEFTKIEKWAVTDIAVVQVESPYDFKDDSYLDDCSYIPAPIRVNFEKKYQESGVEAMALGWGHTEKWRSQNDFDSYNSEKLRYVSTTILSKPECKKQYKSKDEDKSNQELLKIIDKYMICTLKAGNIDDHGEIVSPSPPDLDGCITKLEKLAGAVGDTCEEHSSNASNEDVPEEVPEIVENPIIEPNDTDVVEESLEEVVELDEEKGEIVVIGRRRNNSIIREDSRRSITRRNGICQNDHGGPLVTWVGGHEVLIGVASVFKLVNGSKCTGPYLFTSTQCNGRFLDCVMNSMLNETDISDRKRRSCDAPPSEKGYYTIERRISWIDHPDGPADNEILETRPQIPLYKYHSG